MVIASDLVEKKLSCWLLTHALGPVILAQLTRKIADTPSDQGLCQRP